MKNESFETESGDTSPPAVWQKGFNRMIEQYNDDFLFFLRCAASGHYQRLIESGKDLHNLHERLIFMQHATGVRFEIVPLPFTFRHGSEYYQSLGFNAQEVAKIHGFFDYVEENCKKDFEECVKEDWEFLNF